uniref:DUF433 domain-containing protein n=1 Tax=Ammonifex degensii TaxID=42838 RepID=A0A7C2IQR6_9THEO
MRRQPRRSRREVKPQEILTDYPDLEPDDTRACLAYACALGRPQVTICRPPCFVV